jgi:hypothetical protein
VALKYTLIKKTACHFNKKIMDPLPVKGPTGSRGFGHLENNFRQKGRRNHFV